MSFSSVLVSYNPWGKYPASPLHPNSCLSVYSWILESFLLKKLHLIFIPLKFMKLNKRRKKKSWKALKSSPEEYAFLGFLLVTEKLIDFLSNVKNMEDSECHTAWLQLEFMEQTQIRHRLECSKISLTWTLNNGMWCSLLLPTTPTPHKLSCGLLLVWKL